MYVLQLPLSLRSGCLTPAVSGAHLWAEWLHHPYLLGGPHTRTKSEVATEPLPSTLNWAEWLHQSIWLHHPCLLGIPMVGGNQYGYITPAFSRSPWWGEINVATSPLPSRGPHGGEKSIWLHHPAFSGAPWWGEINLVRSGCGANEQKACEKGCKWVKLGENLKMPHPQCGRSIKTCCQITMMPKVSQNMGF